MTPQQVEEALTNLLERHPLADTEVIQLHMQHLTAMALCGVWHELHQIAGWLELIYHQKR